jgi:hypothetical protein
MSLMIWKIIASYENRVEMPNLDQRLRSYIAKNCYVNKR